MINQFALSLLVIIFSAVFSYLPAAAKEDTAQITLKKTAISKKNTYTYTVKKGDILSVVVRNIPGITEEDIADNYQLIQELNPDIPDLNKLKVGQSLVLPGKPFAYSEEKKMKTATTAPETIVALPAAPPAAPSGSGQSYTIKKGDTLIKIIYRELKIKTDIKKTLQIIQSMNPRVVDINKIYAGDTIKLPSGALFVQTAKETSAAQAAQKEEIIVEKTPELPGKIIEVKEKMSMPPEARLAVLRYVITQMNGSFNATGNYYLPIPKTGQVKIDCSKMPVIEFDGKTTIFLDLENRAPDNLKKIINDNWANYYLIKADKKDDVITILKKVFDATKSYSMTKKDKPMTIGALPPVELFVDWLIVKTNAKEAQALAQGLRIIYENNLLLPRAVKNYARKNGVIITEISEESGLVGKPEEIYSLPPMPVYPTVSAKDFSYALVSDLGFNAEKDVDIKIFDTAKDGVNLSIKADILVKDGNKKYVIFSKNLTRQLITVLKEAGNELIFVADNETPKNIMEKILRALNITFTSGYFTFSGIDKNQAPYTISFGGTKIKTDKDLYVIDFDIDQELRGLLREVWSANIARY
ncbi:MAG: LysM peptidoglycan-binding domain-containing protein [Smithellaceae bacterium]|jgi:LysM repeat protein